MTEQPHPLVAAAQNNSITDSLATCVYLCVPGSLNHVQAAVQSELIPKLRHWREKSTPSAPLSSF